MHLLTRVCLQNWYLIGARDIDVREATALVGPTGAGKSSIQDAIQTVITGANQNRLHLNPSASGKSQRSVLEYCLGMTKDPSEGGRPLREACETVLALVFRDEETDEPITVGVAMSARLGDSREEVLSRFIVPGHAYSVEDARRRNGSNSTLAPWAEVSESMRSRFPSFEEYRTSAEKFTSDMLAAMRGPGAPVNARHFLRAFSNALAFKPIFDPTVFVREFVLEPDHLDVERVRTSIDTWRELERLIADVEAKLRRVSRLNDRFELWGRARLKGERHRFVASAADSRRLAHETVSALTLLREKSGGLADERRILATRRQWVRDLDSEIRSKQSLLASDGEAARVRQIEMEAGIAERDGREAEGRWTKVRTALSDLARLSVLAGDMRPKQAKAVDAAKQALALAPEGMSPADALRGRGERLQALVDEALGVEGWDVDLDDQADRETDEVRRMQQDLERIEQGLARSSGQALLSRETMKLLAALDDAGIPATPLCELVEVTEPSWQYAVEALLGRGREALVVPPSRLNEAFDLMWRDRDAFAGCTLVKTTATDRIDARFPNGSVLEAISTDDLHAAAFLAVRIGSFRKAESEVELDRLDRGVMRSGKTSSGMGLSVQRTLRELVLGKSSREASVEALRNEAGPLRERLLDARGRMRLMREAARLVPAIVAALKDGSGPFDLEHAVNTSRTRREALLADRRAAADAAPDGLLAQVEDLVSSRDGYVQEISDEIEPQVEKLQGEVADARARFDVARQGLKSAVAARRKAWSRYASAESVRILALDRETGEDAPAVTCRKFRAEVMRDAEGRRDPRGWYASLRNDNRTIAENAEAEARREQSGAIREMAEYGANWNVDVPQVEAETMTLGYAWAAGERVRLEGNELREHRESCERAAIEMRRMLKEDLLSRLAEKLGKVGDRLDGLNGLLTRHRFTGQTYAFTCEIDQRFAPLHELALKVGLGDGSIDDAALTAAVADLEGMIEGAEDAGRLADYRQYFTYEIVMTGANGARTTMSTRAVKGSGGEAQAPFYVAIAASLASAYFPGHSGGKPKGMGLALFDEAFNKLDVPNTQALLQFFRDMGLQLMIAGPEDKRATFTEVLDSIVLVNKSLDGESVYVDVEHPGAMARAALGEINPDHRGMAGFAAAE